MNKKKVKISTKKIEDCEKKYGKWFSWHRPYYYFFNEERNEVTIYDWFKETAETYRLDELKKKIKEILNKKNLEASKEPSTEFLSKAVSRGLDLDKSQEMLRGDIGSVIMFCMSGASLDIEKKLSKKEKKLYHAIPSVKQVEFLELTKEKNYKNFLSSLENNKLQIT